MPITVRNATYPTVIRGDILLIRQAPSEYTRHIGTTLMVNYVSRFGGGGWLDGEGYSARIDEVEVVG